MSRFKCKEICALPINPDIVLVEPYSFNSGSRPQNLYRRYRAFDSAGKRSCHETSVTVPSNFIKGIFVLPNTPACQQMIEFYQNQIGVLSGFFICQQLRGRIYGSGSRLLEK